MGSCWYERDDCARCTLDSSSRLSQRGKEKDPCGLNLTEHRHAAMLGGVGPLIMARACVFQ